MKKILKIIIFILISNQLQAAHCYISYSFHYFPEPNDTIKQNSAIIYTASSLTKETLGSLYLESGKHKVKLNINGIYKGMRGSQAIFVPDKLLKPDKKYYLKSDDTTSMSEKYEPISWFVERGKDLKAPRFKEAPKLISKEASCNSMSGLSTYVGFSVPAKDKNDIFIKTELVDLYNKKNYEYFVKLNENDTLSMRGDDCYGSFHFNSYIYKIRFSLIDICGNENNEWTPWIEFSRPYPTGGNIEKWERTGIADTTVAFISGLILDENTKEPLPFANISFVDNKTGKISSTDTNFEGEFQLTLPASIYEMKAGYPGFKGIMVEDIDILTGDIWELIGELKDCY